MAEGEVDPAPDPTPTPSSPVVISPENGADIATVLETAKAAVDKVGDITINLAEGGAYTISKTLEAPAGIVINGNGATVDASALEAPFITMSATPSAELINNFNRVGSVKIANVKVNGLKNSIFYDNNKPYCVVDFTIDNSVLALATEAVQNEALISFKAGGAKDVNITNSTFYGNNAVAKYFIRYNNSARLDRYGFDKDTEFQTMNYQNNTFYGLLIADGEWGNYNGIAGQKYSKFDVKNNIWYNCGKEIIRRMAGGRFSGSNPMEFANNTYFNDGVDQSASEANYDKSGTILTTDPTFKDAAKYDFTIGASTKQAEKQTGDPRWLLPVDITISPAADANIATELATAKAAVKHVGNITINLTKDAAYTIDASIEAPASIVINGNGATIDASALVAPFITMSATPSVEANEKGFFPINDVVIKDVKVTGLAQQLFYANKVKYLMNNLICENSIIQVAGGNKTVFDFNGGGVTAKLDINKSTIYANPQNTGALYSSQSGQKATEAGLEKQTISIFNSTISNIAYGKNFSNHRQANQTWLEYVVKNNIFLDCGKKGQVIKGLNGGQSGKNPVWAIDKNTFLYTVDGTITDTSAEESTGDADEPITNSLITNPTFADAANGDFTIGASTQQAKLKTGDPRWLTNEYVAPTIDKTALETEIATATTLLGDASTEDGTAGATLMAAINAAQTILDNAEFQEEIDAAVNTLQAAEEAYKATGISDITTGAADNGAWYNMQGVKVEKPTQKGVYIHNGKKIVVR